jgi:hypothetical protein
MNETAAPATIDAYIASAPIEVQPILHQIRATVREAAPERQGTIKYGMTTFMITIRAQFDGFSRDLSALYASGSADLQGIVAVANRHGVGLESDRQ